MYKSWVGTFPEPEQKLNEIVSSIPLGKRMTTPEEIAAMALFLISGQAGHITGQHLYVDGGYVASRPGTLVNPPNGNHGNDHECPPH